MMEKVKTTIKELIETKKINLGKEKHTGTKVPWERDEIVFGGYWQSAAPALAAWMCSGTYFAGFLGIRGVLPDQRLITQKYNEDVAGGRPPGRGSDFDKNTNDFITSWTSSLDRHDILTTKMMASTPVLLTLLKAMLTGSSMAKSWQGLYITPSSALLVTSLRSLLEVPDYLQKGTWRDVTGMDQKASKAFLVPHSVAQADERYSMESWDYRVPSITLDKSASRNCTILKSRLVSHECLITWGDRAQLIVTHGLT
ncbi:hypothetical protein BKA64DRAFT_639382 [Cadophora sp. MPI-SDFR-AT-0126]|nr:hypothetical protein BKA64DRAFT_639382 [Leotiomycetes sp. MPI-SDFR-AT-0126]